MSISFEKQTKIQILPAFNIYRKYRLKETDLNEVVQSVEDVLPLYVNRDVDVSITLLEKNLQIMADMALMKEALTHLVKNTMDAMPYGGKFWLSANEVNFEINSLIDDRHSIFGACAFVSLVDAGISLDEKIKEVIFEPFFTTKINEKGLGLPIAYRIFKEHQRTMPAGRRPGKGAEANIYLPLTKHEMVNMMSIPLGSPRGRIH